MSHENTTDFTNMTTVPPSTEKDDIVPSTRFRFVFVPLGVIVALFVFTTFVYVIVKRKRLDKLRHHLVPLYNFDPNECEDWEDELLEESTDQKQPKKIQDYKSMSSAKVTTQH